MVKETLLAVNDMNALSDAITSMIHQLDKKAVLLIDEIDSSITFASCINFLGMLRAKFLERFSPHHFTFHSVVLAGVHDVKSLKYKIRPPQDSKYLSPWNIATDFKVQMSFSSSEIESMLQEYSVAESVQMDIPLIAKRLYYYTSGYPFLVSKLCKIVAENLLHLKQEKYWELVDIDKSVQFLLKETNTNFDSLIKNGRFYGIFKLNGHLKIHNRIYEQCIYNYMITKNIVQASKGKNYADHFLLNNNQLDMKAVLLKFQQLMKEQYSLHANSFLEEQGRLIFLSFLTPILNGQGSFLIVEKIKIGNT